LKNNKNVLFINKELLENTSPFLIKNIKFKSLIKTLWKWELAAINQLHAF